MIQTLINMALYLIFAVIAIPLIAFSIGLVACIFEGIKEVLNGEKMK